MKIKNEQIFTAQAVSGTTAYNSNPIFLGHIYGLSFQSVFTGSMTGSLQLQVSNDFGNDESIGSGVTNWTNFGSSVSVTGAGSFIINQDAIYFRWARLVYTNATNSGNFSATMNVKGV